MHPTRQHIHVPAGLGDRAADAVAHRSGWWPSILLYLGFTAVYLLTNHSLWHFDVTLQYYTFFVSVLAIFLAQVILLAQNRGAERDRLRDDTEASEVESLLTMSTRQLDVLAKQDQVLAQQDQVLAQQTEILDLLRPPIADTSGGTS